MNIDTRAMDFTLTDALRRHAESSVESALGPVSRWVRGVTARLADVNADRGGIDKRCRLVATLRHRGTVVAEATDRDLYAAIAAAAARLRRSAVRAVRRPSARDRKDPQRPGTMLDV
jgi:ribosomal subunit interface protein